MPKSPSEVKIRLMIEDIGEIFTIHNADESETLSTLAFLLCVGHKRNGADLVTAITETEEHLVTLWPNVKLDPA